MTQAFANIPGFSTYNPLIDNAATPRTIAECPSGGRNFSRQAALPAGRLRPPVRIASDDVADRLINQPTWRPRNARKRDQLSCSTNTKRKRRYMHRDGPTQGLNRACPGPRRYAGLRYIDGQDPATVVCWGTTGTERGNHEPWLY